MSTAPEAAQTLAPLSGYSRQVVDLTFDFAEAALNDGALLDDVPYGVHLILVPPDADPAYLEQAFARARASIARGEDVLFKHWPKPAALPAAE